MKRTKFILLVSSCLVFFMYGLVCAETIIWIHADFPPSTILAGKDKGKGVGDRIEKILQDNLTDYEHMATVANYKRIIDSPVISRSKI